jgi:lysophospholipase L1-like esterase
MRILCLGDSITQGNQAHQSYRYDLWKDLVGAGYDFTFVGSMTSNFTGNPAFPDYQGRQFVNTHEGHYGWKITDVLNGASSYGTGSGKLADWVQHYTADVALVHLGTNDMSSSSAATMAANMALIVDILRTDNPNMAIFLGQIPASAWGSPPWDFNARLATLASSVSLPNSPVSVVDLSTGWVSDSSAPGTDTWDWVHPNPQGEAKIATRFSDAILSLAVVPEPASLALLLVCSPVLLRRRRA